MVKLKDIDLTEEYKQLDKIKTLKEQLKIEEDKLKGALTEKAQEYYNGSLEEYYIKNPLEFTTEDGYRVSTVGYKLWIEKTVENGVITGFGERYDLDFSTLAFSIQFNSGRSFVANAKKHTGIRKRMIEIEKEICVMNPLIEFADIIGPLDDFDLDARSFFKNWRPPSKS